MQTFNCPSCGAPIKFTSSVSVSCVCPFCRSLVVRHDKDVEKIGVMAELPDDMSPLQIGTTGHYRNIGFTLVGRLKIGWEDGCWNEWFMFTDEGKKGWLAEAQGSLAVCFEVDGGIAEDKDRMLRAMGVQTQLGYSVSIGSVIYQITDIKQAECIGSEGELPFAAPRGRKTTSIDLQSRNGDFATVEYDESGNRRIYVGRYVEFSEFHFANLRELPGWKMSRNTQPEEFTYHG